MLSRGGRDLATAIERAHDLGSVFDGWSDHLDLGAWRQALADCGIDVAHELNGRELADTLPWDLIDAGLKKGYLKAEWRRALRETETEDCKWGHCYHCGIPGDGADTQLAPSSLPVLGEPLPDEDRPKVAAYRLRPEPRLPAPRRDRPQAPVHRRYRFTFSKTGDARFLSHRQVMDAFERVLRAAALPVHYTEGFNPHIRLSMGPALALGHEAAAEIFDVDCTAPITDAHRERVNSLLPDGVKILDARPLLPGAPSLGRLLDAIAYRIAPPVNGASWPGSPDRLEDGLREAVNSWQLLDDGSLLVETNARQDAGPTASVKKILVGLGLDEAEAARARVIREKLVLRPKKKTPAASAIAAKAMSS